MQETKRRTKEQTEVGVREEDEEDKEGCEKMHHHGDSIKQDYRRMTAFIND